MKSSKSNTIIPAATVISLFEAYRTAEGQYWYVGEGSDGKSFKMQVEVDEATGEITVLEQHGDGDDK